MNPIVHNDRLAAYRWIVLFVTTFSQATIALISQGVGTLGPFLVDELGLSKTQLGFIGGAVNVGMTLTALLAGRAVDLWGEKRVLITGGLATGAAIFWASTAHSFNTLLGGLLLTGVWAATSTPAGSKAIMTWFPYEQRALALGIRQTGVPLGGIAAALALPLIAMAYGWRTAMITMCIGTIIGSAICFLGFKEHPLEKGLQQGQKPRVSNLFKNKNLWLAGLGGCAYISVQYSLLAYLVLYLHENAGQSVGLASIFLALVQFGGMTGRIVWGFASDNTFHGRRKPIMLICGAMTMCMALLMLLISERTSVSLIGLITFLFGFSGLGWNGIYVTLLSEIAGQEQAGTAVGLGITLLQIGVLIFPPAFGYLIDLNGGTYGVSWVALSALVFLGVLVLTQVKG